MIMIPIDQQFPHSPEARVAGDCYRACVASILELSREAVPHFMEDFPSADEFARRESRWLGEVGWRVITFAVAAPNAAATPKVEAVLEMMGEHNPALTYILGGQSSRADVNHCVVCQGGQVVHDPHPSRLGISRPSSDGYYWISILVKHDRLVFGIDPIRGSLRGDADEAQG